LLGFQKFAVSVNIMNPTDDEQAGGSFCLLTSASSVYPFWPLSTSNRRLWSGRTENLVSQVVSKQSLDAPKPIIFATHPRGTLGRDYITLFETLNVGRF
jgi:hypothetical protein